MTDKKTKKMSLFAEKGKMWVSSHYQGNEKSDQKDLYIRTFESEPAWVRASYGLTINLGNYESARCDAGVTLPAYPEEVGEAFKQAWELAQEQVQEQVKEIKD